jgi:ABC-type branched-subunit amino acid transport system permease subunit
VIVDWIYNHPTWLWGNILVWGAAAVACLGLAVFHRLVHVDVRRAHNDLAGFSIAIISVVYAVLLAFIAVATWEAFAKADTITQTEAGDIGNLYRDTRGFPPDLGDRMRGELRRYLALVIRDEWPVQQRGEVPRAGWGPLIRLHEDLVRFHPQNLGESVIEAEFLRSLNELYKTRTARLIAVRGHIPGVVWWIIAIGGGLTTGFTYLFGFHSFRLHLTMTAAVAASLAIVVVLIIALDWPYRGEVSISSDAYIEVEKSLAEAGGGP